MHDLKRGRIPAPPGPADPDEGGMRPAAGPGPDAPEPLPTALRSLVIKRMTGAMITGLVTLVFFIMSGDGRALFGLIVSAYLLFLAGSVILDYRKSRIAEIPVICTSCSVTAAGRIVSNTISPYSVKSTVVFQPLDCDDTCFYSFRVPGNRTEEIRPNFQYVIYFSLDNPNQLLSFVQI